MPNRNIETVDPVEKARYVKTPADVEPNMEGVSSGLDAENGVHGGSKDHLQPWTPDADGEPAEVDSEADI